MWEGNIAVIMAIVGVNIHKTPCSDKNKSIVEDNEKQPAVLTIEEKRNLAVERRKPEVFSGKDLLSDGHHKKIAKRDSTHAARRQAVLDNLKTIYKTSQETPLQLRNNSGDEGMLMVYHRSMAGKTKVVGTTIFVFNRNGVASTPKINLFDYRMLLKRPGFVKWPRAVAKKVVPPVAVVDVSTEDLKSVHEDWNEAFKAGVTDTAIVTGESEDFDDEDEYDEIPEEIDFSRYNKTQLQEALLAAGIEFESKNLKSVLVGKLDKAWEDDELQEIIYDSLNPEED